MVGNVDLFVEQGDINLSAEILSMIPDDEMHRKLKETLQKLIEFYGPGDSQENVFASGMLELQLFGGDSGS